MQRIVPTQRRVLSWGWLWLLLPALVAVLIVWLPFMGVPASGMDAGTRLDVARSAFRLVLVVVPGLLGLSVCVSSALESERLGEILLAAGGSVRRVCLRRSTLTVVVWLAFGLVVSLLFRPLLGSDLVVFVMAGVAASLLAWGLAFGAGVWAGTSARAAVVFVGVWLVLMLVPSSVRAGLSVVPFAGPWAAVAARPGWWWANPLGMVAGAALVVVTALIVPGDERVLALGRRE